MGKRRPKKVDWVIHYVIDCEGEGEGGIVNIHTHGMENYSHINFQLVLPVHEDQAQLILNSICFAVQDGRRFDVGEQKKDLYNCVFRLDAHKESGRDVLRLILPDPEWRFPENPLCNEPYKYQTVCGFQE